MSTNDQNTDLQRNALNCAGCERIFEDKISGTKSDRPGLKKLLRTLSAGDTLVVWKLDRLGRSMRHLVTLIEELRQRGVNFRSLTDSIDTSTPMGRFFFHVMGALAEMERELIVERTRAGLAAARAKGRVGGRRPKLTTEQWAQIGRLTGGRMSLLALEQMAEQGKAWPLIEGSGTIYGMYVIEGLNQTKTEFFRDGMPRRIEFTLSLKRVDESLSDMFGDLSTQLNNLQDTATSALSDISKTVGGLLS
ncbi:TPA: recombinase family protein [Escherichia coli]|nr:recombinase family protein [Escherichia coli]